MLRRRNLLAQSFARAGGAGSAAPPSSGVGRGGGGGMPMDQPGHQNLARGMNPGGPYRPFPERARAMWQADQEWERLQHDDAQQRGGELRQQQRQQYRQTTPSTTSSQKTEQQKEFSQQQKDSHLDDDNTNNNNWQRDHPAWANIAPDPQPLRDETTKPSSSATSSGSSSTRRWDDAEEEEKSKTDPAAYTSGHHQVRKWYKLFGLSNTLPCSGPHPDFKLPSEADEIVPDEDIMSAGPSMNGGRPVSAEEAASRQQKRGVNFFKAARKGETTEDPFVAAFAPRAGKKKESSSAASGGGGDEAQAMMQKKQAASEQQANCKKQQQTTSAAQKADEKQSAASTNDTSSSTTTTGQTAANAATEAASAHSRFQVGGATLGEWRGKINKIRARGEGNLVSRLQGEIGFAHILSQTGQPEDARECLEVGDYVWKKLADLKHASPDSEGSTHGVVINVCSAMKRAARSLGESERMTLWEERLDQSSRKMMERATNFDPSKMNPQEMEPEKKTGRRKFKIDANSMWSTLRNPITDQWGWAKKYLTPDPDKGSRYTK